jgi:hypothetical protein
MKGNSGRGHELSNGMFGIKSVHEDGMFLTLVKEAAVLLQLVS